MKKIKDYTFLGVFLILACGCSKNKNINEYSQELQINFPQNMELIYYHNNSEFQDYSIHSVYKLSFNEKNDLLAEIIDYLCDSTSEYPCWNKCNDF